MDNFALVNAFSKNTRRANYIFGDYSHSSFKVLPAQIFLLESSLYQGLARHIFAKGYFAQAHIEARLILMLAIFGLWLATI